MNSQRRIPKRSIVGTRVNAPWGDGRFYCGVVESMTEQPNGQFMYSVLFDDGYSKIYFYKDIVGPGFNTTADLYLKHGQKVYITHQGRELTGSVVKHNRATNEVLLEVESNNGEVFEMLKRLDEIRLMESRKSARLNTSNVAISDHDMESQSQSQSEANRSESQRIDVPRNKAARSTARRRKTVDNMITEESEDGSESVDIDSDMQLAAMALQNLSCSPASPHFPIQSLTLSRSPHSWNDRTGFRPSPSPPPASHYSLSAPMPSFFGSASTDEGIEVEDTMYPMDDVVPLKRQKSDDIKSSSSTIRYKCTWKGCNIIESDCDDIEKHIRDAHLGPREDDLSDHEEDFYYEEIEENDMDEMTATMEVMTCASPTQSSPLNLSLPRQPVKKELKPAPPIGIDHEHNRRDMLMLQQLNDQRSNPILIPGAPLIRHKTPPPMSPYIVPHNSPYSRQTFKTGSPLSPTTSSPKHTMGTGRKSRSDIKKCRKVYGMENRDRWCTQCKWKKACTRFVPEVVLGQS